MTYRCGIGASLGALCGLVPRPDPCVICDGCGVVVVARTKRGDAPMWLLNGKAPKGWLMIRHEDHETGAIHREDYCPACRMLRAVTVTG